MKRSDMLKQLEGKSLKSGAPAAVVPMKGKKKKPASFKKGGSAEKGAKC